MRACCWTIRDIDSLSPGVSLQGSTAELSFHQLIHSRHTGSALAKWEYRDRLVLYLFYLLFFPVLFKRCLSIRTKSINRGGHGIRPVGTGWCGIRAHTRKPFRNWRCSEKGIIVLRIQRNEISEKEGKRLGVRERLWMDRGNSSFLFLRAYLRIVSIHG